MSRTEPSDPGPSVSLVIPVLDEAGNIAPLVAEIDAACAPLAPYEVVFVDDGSRDATPAELADVAATRPHVRVLRLAERCGKAEALRAGVVAARAPIIATMDGDGQNDPAFVPAMVEALRGAGDACGLCVGQRVGRKGRYKAIQSRMANAVRRRILRDATRDTGCGMKVVRRDVFLRLPHFDGLHRFLPALVAREGLRVVHVDVVDRPRGAGRSKYGLMNRLWVGILDLLGVWWLIRRRNRVSRPTEIALAREGETQTTRSRRSVAE